MPRPLDTFPVASRNSDRDLLRAIDDYLRTLSPSDLPSSPDEPAQARTSVTSHPLTSENT